MFWKLFEFSVSRETTIDAPCDTVWEIVLDIDHRSTYFSAIRGVERIDGSKPGSPIRVGSKFRQYIDMGNMKTNKEHIIPLEYTVASLDDDDNGDNRCTTYPRTLAVYSDDFTQRIPGRVSATVEPGADSDTSKSNLRITSTLLPKTLCMLLGGNSLICVCYFRTMMETMIERDLEEFARAAEAAAEASTTTPSGSFTRTGDTKVTN